MRNLLHAIVNRWRAWRKRRALRENRRGIDAAWIEAVRRMEDEDRSGRE